MIQQSDTAERCHCDKKDNSGEEAERKWSSQTGIAHETAGGAGTSSNWSWKRFPDAGVHGLGGAWDRLNSR